MHPEFLGARIKEAAAGARTVSATPADALDGAWPSAAAWAAPLLVAAPSGDVAADHGTASKLHPQLPTSGGVSLDSLAELLGWDTQVRHVSTMVFMCLSAS